MSIDRREGKKKERIHSRSLKTAGGSQGKKKDPFFCLWDGWQKESKRDKYRWISQEEEKKGEKGQPETGYFPLQRSSLDLTSSFFSCSCFLYLLEPIEACRRANERDKKGKESYLGQAFCFFSSFFHGLCII